MPAPRVLVIDDETPIRSVVRAAVEADGGTVFEAATGESGLALVRLERPHVVVLDLGLPDVDGLSLCQRIRSASPAAILVLSARHTDQEKALLLDAGADDYLTKPFSTLELRARVRAQWRRVRMLPADGNTGAASPPGFRINRDRREVERDGHTVHLTPTEWALLEAFMQHPGRTLTHAQLFEAVWGRRFGDAQQYLRVYVANLRRKVERDPLRPTLIRTEPGVGYRFEWPE